MIIMYTMDNCSLCDKAKDLLDYWNLEYATINIEPYLDRPYPYFDIDGKIFEYEELVDMIAKGEI